TSHVQGWVQCFTDMGKWAGRGKTAPHRQSYRKKGKAAPMRHAIPTITTGKPAIRANAKFAFSRAPVAGRDFRRRQGSGGPDRRPLSVQVGIQQILEILLLSAARLRFAEFAEHELVQLTEIRAAL